MKIVKWIRSFFSSKKSLTPPEPSLTKATQAQIDQFFKDTEKAKPEDLLELLGECIRPVDFGKGCASRSDMIRVLMHEHSLLRKELRLLITACESKEGGLVAPDTDAYHRAVRYMEANDGKVDLLFDNNGLGRGKW